MLRETNSGHRFAFYSEPSTIRRMPVVVISKAKASTHILRGCVFADSVTFDTIALALHRNYMVR